MPRKLTKQLWKPEFQIFPSGGEYYWRVQRKESDEIPTYATVGTVLPGGRGTASSFDQALRAARNFIRHNQNLVYA